MPSTYTGVVNEDHLNRVVDYVVDNARKDGQLYNPITGRHFELDVFLPLHRLGFEFQDDYHYMTTWYAQISLSKIENRDRLKKEVATKNGITLILVPCWWDGAPESLLASICFERPDLIPSLSSSYESINHLKSGTNIIKYINNVVSPVPLNPSTSFFNARQVPDVGELMSASYPPHLSIVGDHFSSSFISIARPWWLGEKYDGIRSCWNPKRQLLFSRTGYSLNLHPSFVSHFPPVFLDGETWFGRGFFADSQHLISSTSANWPFLRQIAFDNPDASMHSEPFEARYSFLLDSIPFNHPFIKEVWRVKCNNKKKMMNMLSEIMGDGGEGIILRAPKSPYVNARSDLLWKLKATKGDQEALVLQVHHDKSCLLQLPNGVTFTVTKENTKNVPHMKEGDVVTFQYDNYTRGGRRGGGEEGEDERERGMQAPVNAVIFRDRRDLSWLDVVRNFFLSLPSSRSLNEVSQKITNYTTKPAEYWTEKKRSKMRKICENYAKGRKLDPLDPLTWYSIARDFSQLKEVNFILLHYKMSVVKAIIDLFPEVKLKISKFNNVTRNYWAETKNRREFFCEIAKRMNFDPLTPSNWYSVSFAEINKLKGAKAVLRHHGSISKALIHLFPEITFDKLKFPPVAIFQHHWRDRRRFFVDYAKKMEFDPYVPQNWYSVSLKSVLQQKGAHTVLQYYRGRLKQALVTVFPNIGLEKDLFKHPQRAYWMDFNNQREFLSSLAKELNFDPLVASAWSSITVDMVKSKKGGRQLMQLYDNNLSHAVRELFLLDAPDRLPAPKIVKKRMYKTDPTWRCYNCHRGHEECGKDKRKLLGREEEGSISCAPCAFYYARNNKDRPMKLVEKVKKKRLKIKT